MWIVQHREGAFQWTSLCREVSCSLAMKYARNQKGYSRVIWDGVVQAEFRDGVVVKVPAFKEQEMGCPEDIGIIEDECCQTKPCEHPEGCNRPLKPGDVVQLPSGGPRMTVEEVENNGGEDVCGCVWYDEEHGAVLRCEFAPDCLERCEC